MDSEFCRHCQSLTTVLLEYTHRGSKIGFPYRTVYVQLLCLAQPKSSIPYHQKILAMEQVGKSEVVSDDYALLCQPNDTYTGIISKDFLSDQMLDDYDDALKRAFSRIDGYGSVELPEGCEYTFEQELSDMAGRQ